MEQLLGKDIGGILRMKKKKNPVRWLFCRFLLCLVSVSYTHLMMNTTVSAVGSIVNGLTTFFIAFSFACYILFEKEKLQQQMKKVVFALSLIHI